MKMLSRTENDETLGRRLNTETPNMVFFLFFRPQFFIYLANFYSINFICALVPRADFPANIAQWGGGVNTQVHPPCCSWLWKYWCDRCDCRRHLIFWVFIPWCPYWNEEQSSYVWFKTQSSFPLWVDWICVYKYSSRSSCNMWVTM